MRFYDWRAMVKRSTFAAVNLNDEAADIIQKGQPVF